jgi:GntR family transcriptional repressor for pyruvate dehydrogenase complex
MPAYSNRPLRGFHGEDELVKADVIQIIPRDATLAQHVADQLERLIVQQHFEAGERLPAERELAERFGVSRTVIREAVRTVASKGLLDVRAGSGTLVRKPSSETVAASVALLLSMNGQTTPAKVVEVRRILEVEIAGLAAQRRTDDDLRRLESILQSADEKLDDPDNFIETDIAFHAALAQGTQNELFSVLLSSIANVMTEVRVVGLRVPGTPKRALRYHRDIFRAVERGDRDMARDAMNRHMDEAIATMTAALVETASVK